MPANHENNDAPPASTEYGAGWGNPTVDLMMPSGAKARVIRPGVSGLVSAGVLDNVDFITNIVSTKHIARARGAKAATVDEKSLMKDPAAIMEALAIVEKVVAHVVVLPPITWAYEEKEVDGKKKNVMIPYEERKAHLTYSDSIPEEDKMFILNFVVGGSKDLERFRKQMRKGVGSLADG